MPKYVIDTNVPIVANGTEANFTPQCRESAVRLLMLALKTGIVVIDSAGEIQEEYRRHLNPKGQPGVGDRFYKEIINSHPARILRVDLPKRDDGEYEDLPQPIIESNFDPSDRKFAAAAKKTRATVYNAVDTDWLEQRDIIEQNGIPIVFLCGCNAVLWHL